MSKQDAFGDVLANLDEILAHPRVLGLAPGFQDLWSFVSQDLDKYPPHNVIKHGENNWLVEVAVAGFTRDELDIEVTGDTLQITGHQHQRVEASDTQYVHRGVARRDFKLSFKLGERCEVGEASYQSGMLLIPVERTPPVKKVIRKVPITEYDSAPDHDGLGPVDAELTEDQLIASVEEQMADLAERNGGR